MRGIDEILDHMTKAHHGPDVLQDIIDATRRTYEDGHAGSIDLTARETLLTKADKSDLVSASTEALRQIAVERARINGIETLPEGSGISDAVEADLKIGYDGSTYDSAGEATRGQATAINSALTYLIDGITRITSDLSLTEAKEGSATGNANAVGKELRFGSTSNYYYRVADITNVDKTISTFEIKTRAAASTTYCTYIAVDANNVVVAENHTDKPSSNGYITISDIHLPSTAVALYVFYLSNFDDGYVLHTIPNKIKEEMPILPKITDVSHDIIAANGGIYKRTPVKMSQGTFTTSGEEENSSIIRTDILTGFITIINDSDDIVTSVVYVDGDGHYAAYYKGFANGVTWSNNYFSDKKTVIYAPTGCRINVFRRSSVLTPDEDIGVKIYEEVAPLLFYTPDMAEYDGDCTIIKCGQEVIMIDCSVKGAADMIIDYCINNNLTKITRFICSHYHSDHMGGFEALLESEVDFSECTFYLPATPDYTKCIDGSGTYGMTMSQMNKREETVKGLLNDYGYPIVVPSDNQTTVFGDIVCHWLNNDPAKWEQRNYYTTVYDSSSKTSRDNTIINNFSLCCELIYYGKTVLLTGDIEPVAQSYISTQLWRPPEIYKVEHHGVNRNINNNFARLISPKIAVIEGAAGSGTRESTYALRGSNVHGLANKNGEIVLEMTPFDTRVLRGGGAGCFEPQKSTYCIPTASIQSGDDLDDIVAPGSYQNSLGSNAASDAVSHQPDGIVNNYRMDVIALYAESRLKQHIMTRYGDEYVRYYTGATWTAWKHTLSFGG